MILKTIGGMMPLAILCCLLTVFIIASLQGITVHWGIFAINGAGIVLGLFTAGNTAFRVFCDETCKCLWNLRFLTSLSCQENAMNRARQPLNHPDRFLDCQAAMEDHFNEIMDAASAAGWTPAEASAAIVDLADNYMVKLFSINETSLQISQAIARQRNDG